MKTEAELYETMSILQTQLDTFVRNLRIEGVKLAECERLYKTKLMQEVLKLRDEGMAITLVDKICYGIPEVADLRSKRDIQKVIFQTVQEQINSTKLNMRIIDNQIARDYGVAK